MDNSSSETPETVQQVTMKPAEALDLAVQLHRNGQLDDAERIYRTLLQVEALKARAMHFLGMLHFQKGEAPESIRLIRGALDIAPNYTDAINNLGNIHKHLGDVAQAVDCYRQALALDPQLPEPHYNLGILYRRQKDHDQAAAHFRQVLSLQRARPGITAAHISQTYHQLYRVYHFANRPDAAIDVLREWLVHDPDNPIARHALAAYTQEGIPDRASDDYIKKTFDGFAASYDTVLSGLDYHAHELVNRAVEAIAVPEAAWNILDAGCGTGLCGPLLKPFARRLVGVDLSAGMLAAAALRAVYDDLIESELNGYLDGGAESWDLIVAADTLVYFGDLRPVFQAFRHALTVGGYAVLSVEARPDGDVADGFRLNPHGRYAHSQAYVEAALALAGLDVVAIETGTLRQEGGTDVAGLIVTARRSRR